MTNSMVRPMHEAPRIYNLFPLLAGDISAWRRELPHIAGMGFNWVWVNPFHYPGFSGSLYAVKDYFRLNPIFRNGADKSDDELLTEFVAAANRHGLQVMMDLVVNHTSKDSELVAHHPEWFARGDGGDLVSPKAIDPANASNVTTWGDLAEIDWERPEVRDSAGAFFSRVAQHYLQLGFRGFRCDAAYKVPSEAWERLITAARSTAPDAIFAAETLGAPLQAVRQLAPAGFDYFFNSVKWWDWKSLWLLEQYETFRHIAPSIGFPESHDTERLGGSEAEYRRAYAFAATFSAGVMMPMGFETGAAKRLDVVGTRAFDKETPRFDLTPFITGINQMKASTPALNEEGPQQRLTAGHDPVVALARRTDDGSDWAFILVNADERQHREIEVDALLAAAGGVNLELEDVTPGEADGGIGRRVLLDPLQLRVLHGRPATPAQRPAKVTSRRQHPDWSPTARIVVEAVYPELDGGRFPIKRVTGDTVEVWADIFRDGHDKLAAVVKYRPATDPHWREAPMRLYDNDRWTGSVTVDRVAVGVFVIEAWTDHWASWRDEVGKKRAAGQRVALELIEGRALVEEAMHRAEGDDRRRLRHVLGEFDEADEDSRAALLLSELVRQLMDRNPDRRDATCYRHELEIRVDRKQAIFAAWYEMFPRSQGTEPDKSATFDDCIRRLPYVRDLGFDVVYFVPIHPIGKAHRKGRNNSLVAAPGDPGSPYAIGGEEGGHTAIHPELGTLADFRRFVAEARGMGMEVALDFAIQSAPDHPWLKEHPSWFRYRPDGTIKYAENPPKKYQDIVNVDFYNRDRDGLWAELRDVILFWCEQGVTTFRVDNPHTKPVPFWEWLIREVHDRHPQTMFLSEAFTRPKMLRYLAKAGFTQSYTYFTWRNTKQELTEYLTELTHDFSREYLRPNFFANTPDILPEILQKGGRPAFRTRFVLAATLSGVYGIYNGYELCENAAVPGKEEYLHSEKYEYKVWDWDRPGNIKDEIRKLNRFRRENPALQQLWNLRFCIAHDENILFYAKWAGSNLVFCAVNLDPFAAHEAWLDFPADLVGERFRLEELYTGAVEDRDGRHRHIRLDPHDNPAAVWRATRL
jgi:starch synthase (maltosyl-transferring)